MINQQMDTGQSSYYNLFRRPQHMNGGFDEKIYYRRNRGEVQRMGSGRQSFYYSSNGDGKNPLYFEYIITLCG